MIGSAIYGPRVVAIEGNYDDVNRLCSEIADKYGWAFVNVNIRPYYTEGAKTYGFEIAEQLGWQAAEARRDSDRGGNDPPEGPQGVQRASRDRTGRRPDAGHLQRASRRLRAGRFRRSTAAPI